MFSRFHHIFDALTRRERRAFGGAALIGFAAFALWSSHVFYSRTTQTPAEGGSYTEGIVGQPIALNPLIADSNEPDHDLIELLYAPLGDLTTAIQANDDHKIWTVTLKPDLRWSDGEPLTSDDILFTIGAIQNPETRSALLFTWQGIVVERLGEREVRFLIKTPYAFFEENVLELRLVPEHIFGAIPRANLHLSTYNLEPVGSGPYAFAAYTKRKDGFITNYSLQANPFYAREKALIQEFEFRFFTYAEEAVKAFNRKEIDGLGGLDRQRLTELKTGHAVRAFPMPRYYAIFLNQAVGVPFTYPEVRAALTFAVDRKELVKRVFGEYATPALGPFPPQFLSADTVSKETNDSEQHSFEEAERLLEEKGWKKNESGIRVKTVKKESIPLTFEMVVPRISFLMEAAEFIQSSFRRLGAEVTLAVLPPGDVSSDIIKSRQYQALLFGNILRHTPDVFSFWHSAERFHPGLNLALFENKTADALLESIRREFNPETRRTLLGDFTELIAEEKPAIFLFSPEYIYVHPKNLGGLEEASLGSGTERFRNASTWFLKTARVFNR